MKTTKTAAGPTVGSRSEEIIVERYKGGRHWAIYDQVGLVAVTVYRKGAFAVAERLGRPTSPTKRSEAMPKLTSITVRAASRQPIGNHGFQEASVALSFAVTEDDPVLDSLADHVSAELDAAFQKLWAKLEGVAVPERTERPVRH